MSCHEGNKLMAARFRAPGFYRAGLMMVGGGRCFAAALTWIVRMSTGHTTFHHFLSADAILTVSLIAVPLAFLVGIGGFDYWFYWAAGRKTRPEDHSGHGAYALEGLLPDQHRPQGDRHPVPRSTRSSSCSSAACWRC